jgi:hypothetical protein
MVGIIALVNANVSGSVSVGAFTVPAATLDKDDIYLNSFVTMTPTSLSSLALAASGTPTIIGGLWAGVRRKLPTQLLADPDFNESEPFEWEGEASSLAPYDNGVADRWRLRGELYVSDVGLQDIRDWYKSTRRGSRPTLVVPLSTINIARLVTFRYEHTTRFYMEPAIIAAFPYARSIHKVTLEMVEIPRVRWPA